MEINNKVVARYLDGRVLKGVTRDFSPNRISFHVEVDGTGEIVELRCRHLKALFFVRSFDGDSARQDLRGFVEGPAETAQGRKIAVRFRDDEFICGYTFSWSPDRDGFFLFPSDAGSNNQRIYVIAASTDEVKAGVQAEALAQRVRAEERSRHPGRRAEEQQGDGDQRDREVLHHVDAVQGLLGHVVDRPVRRHVEGQHPEAEVPGLDRPHRGPTR